MGPLRSRIIKNMGKRGEPILESRLKEYREYLCKDGPIEAGEIIIVGIKGGGLALITSLPEVLEKKCTRMGVGYKLGDVIVIVDMLTKANINDGTDLTDYADYIRNNKGKMLQRTTLLSDVILPTPLKDTSRKELLTHETLGPEHRQNGLNVLRLQVSEINLLREVESEIFSAGEH
jgi:hypothetical protein